VVLPLLSNSATTPHNGFVGTRREFVEYMRSIDAWVDVVRETEGIGDERRHDKRFGMQLQLRWKLVHRRRTIDTGTGCTVDMSSRGLRFEAGREMPSGLNVELSISWPVLLLNVAPMQLLITGRILRSADGWAAIRTVTHEFRTLSANGAANNGLRTPGLLLPYRAPQRLTALDKIHGGQGVVSIGLTARAPSASLPAPPSAGRHTLRVQ
jgi:hypothetical protein